MQVITLPICYNPVMHISTLPSLVECWSSQEGTFGHLCVLKREQLELPWALR